MSDFFIPEEEITKVKRTPITQKVSAESLEAAQYADKQKDNSIPADYIPIRLSSNGKLSMPETLHVKDYNGEDALNIATTSASERTMLNGIVRVLESIVYEDIDARKMHEKEAEELLLNVRLNFWDSQMEVEYPYEEDELQYMKDKTLIEKVLKGEHTLTCSVPIKNINPKPLDPKFKEPIVIKTEDHTYKFVLPRIGDYFILQSFVEKKYEKQIQYFSKLEDDLRFNNQIKKFNPDGEKPISVELKEAYLEYVTQRNNDTLAVKQALLITHVDGIALDTTEEKIIAYRSIPFSVWEQIATVMEEYNFGVQPEVKVISPITGKEEIRRFQFRFQDYLSAVHTKKLSKITVQFGDV